MGLQQGLDAIQLIHNSFEQGYQGELQRQKQQTEKEQRAEELKQHQASIDLAKKVGDAQIAHMQSELDMTHQQQTFERHRDILGLLRTGALQPNLQMANVGQDAMGNQIPDATNSLPPVRGPVTMGGETVQGNEYQLPSDVTNQQIASTQALAPVQADAAGQQAGAVANAQVPAEIKKLDKEHANKMGEIGAQTASQKVIADIEAASREKTAAIQAGASITGQRIAASSRELVAKIGAFMLPEQQEQLAPMTINAAAGVEGTLPTGPMGRMVQLNLSKNGMVPTDAKEIAALKNAPTLVDTLGEIARINAKYATNDKFKAFMNGKIADKDLPTDIAADLHALNTRVINFATSTKETSAGRLTNTQLKTIKDGFYSPGQTTDNQNALLANLSKMAQLNVNANLARYGADQRELIITRNGLSNVIDPKTGQLKIGAVATGGNDSFENQLKNAPKKNVAGHTLDEDASRLNGRLLYK